jgi:hypothetical protein
MLVLLKHQGSKEGSPRGLEHLRDRTKFLPRQLRVNSLHLLYGHGGIFRTAAVELPTHSSHRSGHRFTFAKLSAGGFLDEADRFDTEDTRETNAGGMALSRE